MEDSASPVPYTGRISASAHEVWIGGNCDRPGREFYGLIDEVAIWSRALTPGQVAWLYNDGFENPITLPSATHVVDDDAKGDPGPGTGDISDPDESGSWEHPFDTIQEAINAAADGDAA